MNFDWQIQCIQSLGFDLKILECKRSGYQAELKIAIGQVLDVWRNESVDKLYSEVSIGTERRRIKTAYSSYDFADSLSHCAPLDSPESTRARILQSVVK